MGKLDKARTYACPIKFTITECNAGWTDMTCDFNGAVLDFTISYLLGNQPSALIEALQVFHSREDGYDGLLHVKVDREEDIPNLDGTLWSHVAVSTSFEWEKEPGTDRWRLSLVNKELGRQDFPVEVAIDIWNTDETKTYKFTVMFRDLCYAVAKCFTDALKTYGFGGYHTETFTDDINIRQLLVIKAYALGILSNFISLEGEPEFGYDFTYEEEIQLLTMDM